ncbi:DNA topoisomerase IB [Pseudoroseicyclus tamaricis]|uniref:DNA topoisomerase n=1 Tax=Pseudoroseicyclus tamaricis TaxID=2705421 RepID=A0A6B2JLG2_9RHOB|nr:DNA topoisomerase IB [Pseudoroseicyclus tamaricis]NDV02393.1 DNA topoisomerase IB [Pseudoroseicyclus tamaricis]
MTAPETLPPDLVYYPDDQPGIRRKRCGRGFSYIGPDGTRIDRGTERARLQKLAVPPAYENVWISPLHNGHLQATGMDVRKRKQYRYHPDWSAARSETKFGALAEFGRALPAIRRRITRDLSHEAGDRDFALAAAALLIDRLALRVGNDAYLKANGSYGALTLKRQHVRLKDDGLHISFTAKGGKKVRRRVSDRKLQRVLERARDLPGAELLVWVDKHGERHRVGSAELNAYLADASHGVTGVTAKTFRTWAGTRAAFEAAEGAERLSIKLMAEAAADELGNTPTIARNSYIHPDVLSLAEERVTFPPEVELTGLHAAERRLLAFLERE